MNILAVCRSCGLMFSNPNLVGGSGGRITFVGSTVGPCPHCGGVGEIFDGVYDLASNTVRLLDSVHASPHQLRALQTIFLAAKQKRQSADDVADEVEKEIPELKTLRDVLPKTRNQLYTFCALIGAAITTMVNGGYALMEDSTALTEQDVRAIVEQALDDQGVSSAETEQQAPTKPEKKVGRNDPCPCGSGKKYKKCCLIRGPVQ